MVSYLENLCRTGKGQQDQGIVMASGGGGDCPTGPPELLPYRIPPALIRLNVPYYNAESTSTSPFLVGQRVYSIRQGSTALLLQWHTRFTNAHSTSLEVKSMLLALDEWIASRAKETVTEVRDLLASGEQTEGTSAAKASDVLIQFWELTSALELINSIALSGVLKTGNLLGLPDSEYYHHHHLLTVLSPAQGGVSTQPSSKHDPLFPSAEDHSMLSHLFVDRFQTIVHHLRTLLADVALSEMEVNSFAPPLSTDPGQGSTHSPTLQEWLVDLLHSPDPKLLRVLHESLNPPPESNTTGSVLQPLQAILYHFTHATEEKDMASKKRNGSPSSVVSSVQTAMDDEWEGEPEEEDEGGEAEMAPEDVGAPPDEGHLRILVNPLIDTYLRGIKEFYSQYLSSQVCLQEVEDNRTADQRTGGWIRRRLATLWIIVRLELSLGSFLFSNITFWPSIWTLIKDSLRTIIEPRLAALSTSAFHCTRCNEENITVLTPCYCQSLFAAFSALSESVTPILVKGVEEVWALEKERVLSTVAADHENPEGSARSVVEFAIAHKRLLRLLARLGNDPSASRQVRELLTDFVSDGGADGPYPLQRGKGSFAFPNQVICFTDMTLRALMQRLVSRKKQQSELAEPDGIESRETLLEVISLIYLREEREDLVRQVASSLFQRLLDLQACLSWHLDEEAGRSFLSLAREVIDTTASAAGEGTNVNGALAAPRTILRELSLSIKSLQQGRGSVVKALVLSQSALSELDPTLCTDEGSTESKSKVTDPKLTADAPFLRLSEELNHNREGEESVPRPVSIPSHQQGRPRVLRWVPTVTKVVVRLRFQLGSSQLSKVVVGDWAILGVCEYLAASHRDGHGAATLEAIATWAKLPLRTVLGATQGLVSQGIVTHSGPARKTVEGKNDSPGQLTPSTKVALVVPAVVDDDAKVTQVVYLIQEAGGQRSAIPQDVGGGTDNKQQRQRVLLKGPAMDAAIVKFVKRSPNGERTMAELWTHIQQQFLVQPVPLPELSPTNVAKPSEKGILHRMLQQRLSELQERQYVLVRNGPTVQTQIVQYLA
jgi:hypothetical protein